MNALLRQITKTCGLASVAFCLLMPESAHAIRCRINVVPLNFGTYMPLQPTPADVTGTFNVRCQGQPGSFSIQIGPGLSGNQLARTMLSGTAATLSYNLYQNAARTLIWGDGSPPTVTVIGTRDRRGRPTRYSYPVYGRIFANQGPRPGSYNDSVVVTVLF